jgi:predicted Zn-dependent protease
MPGGKQSTERNRPAAQRALLRSARDAMIPQRMHDRVRVRRNSRGPLIMSTTWQHRSVGILVALAALLGCEQNPVTGRSQLMIVSEEQAQAASVQAYAKTVADAQIKRRLDTNAARTARVRGITDQLVAQAKTLMPGTAGWAWEMHVIDDPNVNAWCMPGGKMAVYTGLIDRLAPSDDELAQVIGHEISHALLQHGRERMSRAVATNMALQVGSVAAGVDLTGLETVAMVALELPNSRGAELEADKVGIELAAKAGYDPQAAVTLWQKMSQLSAGARTPQWLSTHPSDETRIAQLRALVPQMMPYYEATRGGTRRPVKPPVRQRD